MSMDTFYQHLLILTPFVEFNDDVVTINNKQYYLNDTNHYSVDRKMAKIAISTKTLSFDTNCFLILPFDVTNKIFDYLPNETIPCFNTHLISIFEYLKIEKI